MNGLDIALVLVFLWSLYQGFTQGLLRAVTRFVAVFVGTWIASPVSQAIINRISDAESNPVLPFIVFVVTVGVIVGALNFAALILDKLFKAAQLGLPMRIGGAVFGFLKIGLLASVALMFAHKTGVIKDINRSPLTRGSKLYRPLLSMAVKLTPTVKLIQEEHGGIRERIQEKTEEVIEEVQERIDAR